MGFYKFNDYFWKFYKIDEKELVWMYEIVRNNKVILDVFMCLYVLLDIKIIVNFEGIIVFY